MSYVFESDSIKRWGGTNDGLFRSLTTDTGFALMGSMSLSHGYVQNDLACLHAAESSSFILVRKSRHSARAVVAG